MPITDRPLRLSQILLLIALLFCGPAAAAKSTENPRAALADSYEQRDWLSTDVHCDESQMLSARASSFGCYRGYTAPKYSEFVRSSFYVPVRDGTRLAVDVYRPAINGKAADVRLPTVFTYSRYWRAETRSDGSWQTSLGVIDKGQSTGNIDMAVSRAGGRSNGAALLVAHGYVYVRAEARGTGASFGVRNGDMSGMEALDGRDIIEWIAKQPFADGKVGMIGGSYEGMSQLLVASTAPKPLRAIFPMVATFDEYHSSWSGAGVLRKFGLAWLARQAKRDGVQDGKAGSTINPDDVRAANVLPVDADPAGTLREEARRERLSDPEAVDPMTYFSRQSPEAGQMVTLLADALGTTSPPDIMEVLYSPDLLEALLARKPGLREKLLALKFYRDASSMLIEPQDVGPNNLSVLAPRISQSGIALYNWGGWRDFATIDTMLWDANLTNPRKLTMGPWTHGPNEPDDMREAASRVLHPIEQLRWLDYWLKDIDNGILREPTVNYAVMAKGDLFTWKTARNSKVLAASGQPWLLTNTNGLQSAPATNGIVSFMVDTRSGLGDHTRYHDAIGLGPYRLPDLEQHARRGAAAFTTPPLSSPLILSGIPVVRLKIRSSTPDAYLNAFLERVNADGSIELLSDGVMRASHRKLGKPAYKNFGAPFSDSRRDIVDKTPPLRKDKAENIIFEMQPLAAKLEAGTRIRLVISGSEAGANFAVASQPPTELTIETGGRSGSALMLPIKHR
ncbi:CocE/NonD family hydrolase [Sphingorhabdus sp.]|uniref:CocE/NonD family hydrolase n=1 Tax=Sphingorhabdus sp. TaxID=1902408 RepID=UPI0038FCD82D